MSHTEARVLRFEDLDDPHLVDYVGLTDVALRSRTEPERGLYLAESEKVIRRALVAGHHPRSLLLSTRWLEPLADLVATVADAGGEILTGDESVVEALTGFHVHRGAIAAMHRPELPDPAALLAEAHRVVIIEDVVDHTNVGAIFRSVAGLGADAVLVTPRCADPLYRRSVRVSMGTVFQVPWTRLSAWPSSLALVRDAGFTVAALALRADALDLEAYCLEGVPDRLALVLGAEGDGLKAETIAGADLALRIPMAGGVDSLNVAAAAAVALWALSR